MSAFSVIILTHGGAEELIRRLSSVDGIRVAAVIVETRIVKQRPLKKRIERSIKYDGLLETFKKVMPGRGAAPPLSQNGLRQTVIESRIPYHEVENYHSDEARDLIAGFDADLGILFGTNIVRESVFSLPRLGSINIHLGLTPLYRGGPSVFWELFNGENEIGMTVHYVAKKVDSGDVILQKSFPLEYDFGQYGLDFESFLADFRKSMRGPMAEIITEAVSGIAAGTSERIAQDLTIGKRYRLPVKRQKDELRKRLKQRMREVEARNS